MTQYQKLLHEIYGEYIEAFGYKPIKNAWYKISSKGIASFIGTRLLRGGMMDFWISFCPITMPIFGDYAKYPSCETPVTFPGFNLIRFPLNGEKAFECYPMILRKELLANDAFRSDVSEKIRGILAEHIEKYLKADMTPEKCIEFNKSSENLLGYYRNYDQIMRILHPYCNEVVLECLLIINQEREYCLDCYKAATNAWLGAEIGSILAIPENEHYKERICEIIGFVNGRPDLEPMEYVKLISESGYHLKPDYDREKYINRFMWLKGKYAEIISILKSGSPVSQYLEQRHNESVEEYKKLKIELPPFSSYFEG